MDTARLGKRIQELLDEKNISRKQFAEMTGLTEAAISRYINGQREPRAIALSTIASALDTSIDELLGTPCSNPNDLNDAVLLVARSAEGLSTDQKKMLLNSIMNY